MLVALTAAISRRREAGRGERLADAVADESPVARPCRRPASPGTPGRRGVGPLALPDRDLAAVRRRRARRGSCRCPRSRASRCASARAARRRTTHRRRSATLTQRLAGGEAARSRRRPSPPPWCSVSSVAPPMCGVMTTFGKPSSGWRPVAGDGLDHVERGPGEAAGRRAPSTQGGLVDEGVARGVDEVGAGLHAARTAAAPMRSPVVGRRARVQRDEVRASPAGRPGRRAPPRRPRIAAARRTGRRRGPASPNARARAATRRPTWPNPTRPERVAREVVPEPLRAFVVVVPELAAAVDVADDASGSRRASMTRKAIVSSATASAFLPGVVTTGMPRSRRRREVDVDRAAAGAADQPQTGAASRTASLTGAPCTTSTSWPIQRGDHAGGTAHRLPEPRAPTGDRAPGRVVDDCRRTSA